MIITYYGKQFFKITQGDFTLALNPVSKNSKYFSGVHFGSDLALVTTNHDDYNGYDQLSHGEREPFLISGPGDYEVKGVFVKGVISNSIINNLNYINTIYSFYLDGINIVFLGAISEIGETMKDESLNSPDILFVPFSNNLIDPKNTAKLVASLEPKIIIPTDYGESALKLFLKELGEEKVDNLDKLTIKKKDFEGKENNIIILKDCS